MLLKHLTLPWIKLMDYKYNILHDTGKPLCFVGHSTLNKSIYSELSRAREAQLINIEELEDKDQTWYDQYQFIVSTSDVAFKETIVQQLNSYKVDFFSIVHNSNVFFDSTIIGRGTFISAYNATMPTDHVVIGNHVIIGTHCLFGHECVIEDFTHVSSYGYLGCCHIHRGSIIGLRTSIIASVQHIGGIIHIPEYSNIMVDSRITESLKESGTYAGNRRVNNFTSREVRIL